jgi:hypothetical protein
VSKTWLVAVGHLPCLRWRISLCLQNGTFNHLNIKPALSSPGVHLVVIKTKQLCSLLLTVLVVVHF